MPSKFKFKARPRGKRSMGAGGSRSKVRGFRSKRKEAAKGSEGSKGEEPKQTQNLSSGAKAAGSIAKQIVDKALGATEKAAAKVPKKKKPKATGIMKYFQGTGRGSSTNPSL